MDYQITVNSISVKMEQEPGILFTGAGISSSAVLLTRTETCSPVDGIRNIAFFFTGVKTCLLTMCINLKSSGRRDFPWGFSGYNQQLEVL